MEHVTSGAASSAARSVQVSMAQLHAAVWGLAEPRSDGTRFIPARDIAQWMREQLKITETVATFTVKRWIGEGIGRKVQDPSGFLMLRSPTESAQSSATSSDAGDAADVTGASSVTWEKALKYLITRSSSAKRGRFPAEIRSPIYVLQGKWPRMTHEQAVALLREIVERGFGERGAVVDEVQALLLKKPLHEKAAVPVESAPPPVVKPPSLAATPVSAPVSTPVKPIRVSEGPVSAHAKHLRKKTPGTRLAQPRAGRRTIALKQEAQRLLETGLGELVAILWLVVRQKSPNAHTSHVLDPIKILHSHPASGALSMGERKIAIKKMEARRWLLHVPRTRSYVLGYEPSQEEIARVGARINGSAGASSAAAPPLTAPTSASIRTVAALEAALAGFEQDVARWIEKIRQEIAALKS